MEEMSPKLQAIKDLVEMLEGEMDASVKPRGVAVTKVEMKKPEASDEELMRSQHGDEMQDEAMMGGEKMEKEGGEELSDEDVSGLEGLLKELLGK